MYTFGWTVLICSAEYNDGLKVRSELKINTTEVTRNGDPLADWAYTRRFEAA